MKREKRQIFLEKLNIYKTHRLKKGITEQTLEKQTAEGRKKRKNNSAFHLFSFLLFC